MCGRFGSTLTVWDSPMWLVSPISTGLATSVTSTISSPPWAAPEIPSSALVVTAPGAVGGVDQQLRVALHRERIRRVERQADALRGRLDVVLQAGRQGGVADAARRRVPGDEAGVDGAALGQLEDRLAARVGADPERAGREIGLAALGEEVEVGVRIAGRDRLDQLPLGALTAGVEVRRRRARRHEARRRMVEQEMARVRGRGNRGRDQCRRRGERKSQLHPRTSRMDAASPSDART